MLRLLLALIGSGALAALVALGGLAHAQTGTATGFCGYARVTTPTSDIISTGAAYASQTSTASAQSPTIPVLSNGNPIVGAIGLVEGAPIRLRVDGVADPTTLGGGQYGPGAPGGSVFISCGSDLRRLEFVTASTTQGNGVVHWFFYTIGG